MNYCFRWNIIECSIWSFSSHLALNNLYSSTHSIHPLYLYPKNALIFEIQLELEPWDNLYPVRLPKGVPSIVMYLVAQLYVFRYAFLIVSQIQSSKRGPNHIQRGILRSICFRTRTFYLKTKGEKILLCLPKLNFKFYEIQYKRIMCWTFMWRKCTLKLFEEFLQEIFSTPIICNNSTSDILKLINHSYKILFITGMRLYWNI